MSNDTSYQGTSIGEIVEERLLNKSSLYKNYDLSSNSSLNIPIIDDSSSQKLFNVESDEFPEIDTSIILRNVLKISFDNEIKNEMFENDSFRRYISEIENRLSLFNDEYGLVFYAKIYFQQDWEIEEIKNIILLIKFFNIPFKEELKLWNKLSSFVREGLQISEDFLSSKEFIEFNKEFYIKLDLA